MRYESLEVDPNQFVTKNFKAKEFMCPCCGQYLIDLDFAKTLQELRNIYAAPITITSGYRCKAHNAKIRGADDSQHIYGRAADLSCTSTFERMMLVKSAVLAGFNRIGIYKYHVHVDTGPIAPAMWIG